MKTKRFLSLSLFLVVSMISANAQIYVDGESGKVGVGSGFETTPPVKDLEIKGVVKADSFVYSDGTPVGYNSNWTAVNDTQLFKTNDTVRLTITKTGDIQAAKNMTVNGNMQVVNLLKVGVNSMNFGGAAGGIQNNIYTDAGENILIQNPDLTNVTPTTDKAYVGIGYSNPSLVSQLLDVNGNINLTGNLYNNGKQVLLSSHNNSVVDPASNSSAWASHVSDMGYPGEFAAEKALDGNPLSKWMSSPPPTTDEWLIINLKKTYNVSEVRLSTYPNEGTFGDIVKIWYSIDNVTYTEAGTITGSQMSDAIVPISPPVTASYIKIEMSQSSTVALFAVSEITMQAIEAIPEPAIWEKQRTSSNTFTDNIFYNNGNVSIGKDMIFNGNGTFNGWDNIQNKWVPKTLTTNWRGTLLFSRFVVQEPMVGPDWGRGLISQNLKYNETTDLYETINGTTYPDFAAMFFENQGDIGFFTRDQTATSNVSYTKTELNTYRRMTITRDGDVKIFGNLKFADGTTLNPLAIQNLYSASGLWTKDNNSNNIFRTLGNVGIGTSDPGSATLKIYKASLPMFEIEDNTNTRLQIYVNNSATGIGIAPGDIVYKPLGPNHRLVFHLSDNNNDGNSYFQFSDDLHGGWFRIYNNKEVRIDGTVFAREIRVQTNVFADYVFNKNYKLRTLQEVEKYVKENNHLPDVPSEAEVKENGMNVSEMNTILLKKVEELTLYMIEQNKKLEAQQKEIELLKNKSNF